MTENPVPESLTSEGETLVIRWSDGAEHRLKWRVLRDRCPCASCRGHGGERPPADPLPVIGIEETQPVRPTAMRPVGNYAYNIQFSDGHNTGIYTLEYLWRLGEEQGSDRPE